MQTFAYHELENYKATGEGSQFQELRKQRNLVVHPVEPVAAYQLKDIVKYLNHCRNGIGELLAKFREYSGTDTRIGFIQKVRTAPKISLKKS